MKFYLILIDFLTTGLGLKGIIYNVIVALRSNPAPSLNFAYPN